MGEAYVTGAAAITALRVTLTEIKLGRDPLKDLSTEPGQPTSLCHVDPFDVLTTSNERAERWYKVSKSINLSDAPSIRVRYVEQSWEVPATPITPSPDFDAEAWYDGWLISGMCLKSECRTLRPGSESYYGLHTEGTDLNDVVHDDLNYFVTPYADLFYSTPPLSEHQVHAVDTLNRLATDEFWLSEAHKNGIYDDATVKAMASRAREMISKMLAPGKVPRMGEGGNSINILGYQG
jgi:hypothetical protein